MLTGFGEARSSQSWLHQVRSSRHHRQAEGMTKNRRLAGQELLPVSVLVWPVLSLSADSYYILELKNDCISLCSSAK